MSASGMVAGKITLGVNYTAVPALATPPGNPSTATSMAQAIFEQIYPLIIAIGGVSGSGVRPLAAALSNGIAAAVVGYMQANAVANVTNQSLGALPLSTTPGTPIAAPASPVLVPIE